MLAGDYNVILEPQDCDNPASWVNDALFQPESRAAWRALRNLGLTDAHAAAGEAVGTYTFWDYQASAWQRNHGIRIDHAFLSPQAADRLEGIETHTRHARARKAVRSCAGGGGAQALAADEHQQQSKAPPRISCLVARFRTTNRLPLRLKPLP